MLAVLLVMTWQLVVLRILRARVGCAREEDGCEEGGRGDDVAVLHGVFILCCGDFSVVAHGEVASYLHSEFFDAGQVRL